MLSIHGFCISDVHEKESQFILISSEKQVS